MTRPADRQPPTVAIALMVFFFLTVGFVGLAAAVLPGVALMVMTGAGLMLFFVVQYFLWARWLYPIVVRREQEQEKLRAIQKESAWPDSNKP